MNSNFILLTICWAVHISRALDRKITHLSTYVGLVTSYGDIDLSLLAQVIVLAAVQLTNKSILVEVMAWHQIGFSHMVSNYHNLRQKILNVLRCTEKRIFITHWGRVMHICISKLTIIGSDNGLSPGRRQAIIRTNAGILLIGPLGTNFSEILIGIQTFSFKKIHLKMSSAKWHPFVSASMS